MLQFQATENKQKQQQQKYNENKQGKYNQIVRQNLSL